MINVNCVTILFSLSQTENMTADECAKLREMELNLENERKNSYGGKKKKVKPEAMAATTWRDLIPVIKIDICTVSDTVNLLSNYGQEIIFSFDSIGTLCVWKSTNTNYIVDLRGRSSLCLQHQTGRLSIRPLYALR